MTTTIDLSQLPPPAVVETLDYESMLEEYKVDVRARFPELEEDLESEPVIKILETAAFRELLLRQRINDAAQGVLLATASGSNLDQLVALLGVRRLEGEEDAAFRRRAQLALEGFSLAGPSGAYRYYALGADPTVKDVFVTSPNPGDVQVTVLSTVGNGQPDNALITKVTAALSDETVRPLCESVTVQAAEIVEYQVVAALTLESGPDAATVLATARSALDRAIANAHRLGIGAPLSALYGARHVAGVRSVNLTSPAADVAVTSTQAAYATTVELTQA